MAEAKLVFPDLPNVRISVMDVHGETHGIELDNDEAVNLFEELDAVLEDDEPVTYSTGKKLGVRNE